ncbi:hypothetical protein LguiA_013321 [Lonicera macranthoides]
MYKAQILHAHLVKNGLFFNVYNCNLLLQSYINSGSLFHAHNLLKFLPHTNVVSFNTILSGFFRSNLVSQALKFFNSSPQKDCHSWNIAISGCVKNQRLDLALAHFVRMRGSLVKPNSYTLSGLLSACASFGAFQRGKQLHGFVFKINMENDVIVGSAIVDMYSKGGEMNDALKFVRSMPERDIASWNAIICGFAQSDEVINALKLYEELILFNPIIVPNDITFVGVLSACSHVGLVKEGNNYFNDMILNHKITPKKEHYTCMVDLLARAGQLEEAEAVMLALPIKPDDVMWTALLGACKLHGNLFMAKRISQKAKALNSSNYVSLSNSYADSARWFEAIEVKGMMEARGVEKISGHSWIEIGDCMHSFLSGDKLHARIDMAYEMLQILYLQMGDRCECNI